MELSRPDRRRRLDALAAEYVLGTLSPRARARLARSARTDATVAQAIADWEQRLVPFAATVTGITPAPRVWQGIVRRLGLAQGEPKGTRGGWWTRVGFWRSFAIASFAAALALGIAQFAVPPATEPIIVVLAGPDAKPVLVATAPRGERYLMIKAIAPVPLPPDRTLELWALPEGRDPRSLGVIPATGVRRIPLDAPPDIALRNVNALAISVEPPGGSPTGKPTGPVLFTGKLERMY